MPRLRIGRRSAAAKKLIKKENRCRAMLVAAIFLLLKGWKGYYSTSFRGIRQYLNEMHASIKTVTAKKQDIERTTTSNPRHNLAELLDTHASNKAANAKKLNFTNPKQDIERRKARLPSQHLFVANPWLNEEIMDHNAQYLPEDMVAHTFNHTSMTQSAKKLSQELEQTANITGAFDAFQILRSWAYRCDLWRYMILWSQGGLYMDGKIRLCSPVEEWATLEPQHTITLCDNQRGASWQPTFRGPDTPHIVPLYNGFLSAKQHSPVLLETIRLLIDNVQQRKYPGIEDGLPVQAEPWVGCLAVTGPHLLGLAATQPHIPPESVRNDSCRFFHAGAGAWQPPHKPNQDRIGCLYEFDQQEHQKARVAGKARKHYYDLWMDHAIYCDDEGARGDPDCNLTELLL